MRRSTNEYELYAGYTTKTRRLYEMLKAKSLPDGWDTPEDHLPLLFLRQYIWKLLCITAWGHPSLAHVWATLLLEERGDESLWDDGTQKMCDRLNNVVITVSSQLFAA
jgi:hypothetical protein